MIKNNEEQWATVEFDFEFTNDFRLEISNHGNLRVFNKMSDGKILKGSMINGYRIIRLKLYRPREDKEQAGFDYLKQEVSKLTGKLKELRLQKADEKTIAETADLLAAIKKNLSKKFQKDLKARTINYHSLIHRLVAIYFVKKQSEDQTVVAHINYDKLNNKASNLKWMTPQENYEHQRKSPYVIQERQDRKLRLNRKVAKLTVTKVMLLKKLLNQGKPLKQLVKQFKITETQILRIKRNENWADIEAAK